MNAFDWVIVAVIASYVIGRLLLWLISNGKDTLR